MPETARAPLQPTQPADPTTYTGFEEWETFKTLRRQRLQKVFGEQASTPVYLAPAVFSEAVIEERFSLLDLKAINALPPNSICIFNNNDLPKIGIEKWLEMCASDQDALICIWDFDNHHEVKHSRLMAAFSDVYIPCHSHNLEDINKVSSSCTQVLSAGVIQWSRKFLQGQKHTIFSQSRSAKPLGRHVLHPQFSVRNDTIRELSLSFDTVGLVDRSYFNRHVEDRFTEWCSHMAHWIVPTNNDLPIRVFDALISGGIPILPNFLKTFSALTDFQDHLVFYDENDIKNPRGVTTKANELFISQGLEGISKRYELAMEKSHVVSRVEEILERADQILNLGHVDK